MSSQTLQAFRGALKRRALAGTLVLGTVGLASVPFAQAGHAARQASRPAAATINIGTKNFAEEYVVSDMYSLLLQKAGLNTSIKTLGQTAVLQKALLHGDIDLYPEYTGTGLTVVLGKAPIADPVKAYDVVKVGYEQRYHLTWLNQSPFNDTNGVAITRATAAKYHLHSLADLAKVASKLTFAALPDCKGRPDCQAGLESKYKIHFKTVTYLNSQPLIYKAITSGQADVIEVFTTDGPIRANHLVVLTDPRGIFPADHIAPVVRDQTLRRYTQIRVALNRLAPYLTTKAMIKMNGKVILQGQDHMTVARAFLKAHHLI